MEQVSVSLFGLTNHVLSVDVEMNVFNEGFLILVNVIIMLVADFLFSYFKFIRVDLAV